MVGSTDDDLTDLELQYPDGAEIALTPTFASGTTDYTASVLNEVDVVTVIPTLSHSHATYEIRGWARHGARRRGLERGRLPVGARVRTW